MGDEVVRGIHVAAEFAWRDAAGTHSTQLRILGDDVRGYLLVGGWGVPGGEDQEFWFMTVAEAKAASAELGVPADAWSDVEAVGQVQTGGEVR
jgi:hypothetical protein